MPRCGKRFHMKRILAISALVTLLSTSVAGATASGRMPAGVRRAMVTVTFPPTPNAPTHPIRRLITNAKKVHALIAAVNALKPATTHLMCPAIEVLGPVLTVVYRAGPGPAHPDIAQTKVKVTTGTHGSSGSSSCFPIAFSAGSTHSAALTSNSYVRLVGRLSGISIS
jgi:hypothetical protein